MAFVGVLIIISYALIIMYRKSEKTFLLLTSLYWLVPGHLDVTGMPSEHVITSSSLFGFWLLLFLSIVFKPIKVNRISFSALLLAAISAGISHELSNGFGLDGGCYRFSSNVLDRIVYNSTAEIKHARVDRVIDFTARGYSPNGRYFPLFFANDYSHSPQTALNDTRNGFRFGCEWVGYLNLSSAESKGPFQIRVKSNSGSALLAIGSNSTTGGGVLDVESGFVPIRLRYIRTDEDLPYLRLEWKQGTDWDVVPWLSLSRTGKAYVLGSVAYVIHLIAFSLWFLGVLYWLVKSNIRGRCRNWLGLWVLSFYWYSLGYIRIYKKGSQFAFQILNPSEDWATYEGFARAIMSGDWLSRIEYPLIFYNFGYRYLLALMHLLVGEAPADAIILQWFVLTISMFGFAGFIARRYTLVSAYLFLLMAVMTGQFWSFSKVLLDTALSLSVTVIMLAGFTDFFKYQSRKSLLLASVCIGLLLLIRANLLPFLVLGCVWVGVNTSPSITRLRLANMSLFMLAPTLMLLLLPLRTYAVAGILQWLPDNGLYNLWIGNAPPDYAGPNYFMPNLPAKDDIIPIIRDYVVSNPEYYIGLICQKIYYIIGVDVRSEISVNLEVLIPWVISHFGVIYSIKNKEGLHLSELALGVFFILAVNIPLILIFPWSYGWRLSGPSFVVLYWISAVFLASLMRKASGLSLSNRDRSSRSIVSRCGADKAS